MKNIEVVAAVIQSKEGKIFCAKRKNEGELALKWEFPGGKIEENETHQNALKREIKEEFHTDIEVRDYIQTVKHQYKGFHLTLHAYYAVIQNGYLKLTEHTGSQWLYINELSDLDWAEADIPVIETLKTTEL